jgi:hypothetical protein
MSEEEVDELFKSTIDTNNNEIDYRGKRHSMRPWAVFKTQDVLTQHHRVCQDHRGELGPSPSPSLLVGNGDMYETKASMQISALNVHMAFWSLGWVRGARWAWRGSWLWGSA